MAERVPNDACPPQLREHGHRACRIRSSARIYCIYIQSMGVTFAHENAIIFGSAAVAARRYRAMASCFWHSLTAPPQSTPVLLWPRSRLFRSLACMRRSSAAWAWCVSTVAAEAESGADSRTMENPWELRAAVKPQRHPWGYCCLGEQPVSGWRGMSATAETSCSRSSLTAAPGKLSMTVASSADHFARPSRP